jgi:quinoprotein glucose dehydrogenase
VLRGDGQLIRAKRRWLQISSVHALLYASAVGALLSGCGSNAAESISDTDVEAGTDWAVYHGNPGATHYSRLDIINTRNVARLQVAWHYDSGDALSTGSEMLSNPLIIRGRLLFVSPRGRLICLDAATGAEKWAIDPANGKTVRTRQRSRGVTYWTDGREERVLFTFRRHLFAVDMKTGAPIRTFGTAGKVDLREGLGRDLNSISVTSSTPGVIYRDLLILGSTGNTPGHVRAYDVKTGKMRWIFHTIPYPGEVGYETWPNEAWRQAHGANVWSGFTLDEKMGLVFLPTASGGMGDKDIYGADRPGDNLFANSLVALDAATGKRRWHFQTVRHDLWDRDLPAQPTLVTVRRDGHEISAIAQVTKSGFVYVLDRRTGQSLFPLEERAVAPSDVPGETAAKNQIFPLAPQPFARQHLTADLLTQRTPEAHQAVAQEFAKYRSRGPYDPPSLQGTLVFPGTDGGAEWGGTAYDPQTGLLYVNSNEMAWILKLKLRPRVASKLSGRSVYLEHCSGCHREDLSGLPPEIPSLNNIVDRLPEADVLDQIYEGGGRMPAFGDLGEEKIAALMQYLRTGTDRSDELATPTPLTHGPDTDDPEAYIFEGYRQFLDPDGYPAVAPPWGTLSAIDVSTGRYAWKIPLGEYPELVAHGMKDTGSQNYGGAVVTAGGLLFIGATVFDNKFRAYDKRTGELLWQTELPAAGIATPSTYMAGDRQFVVIAAGGGRNNRHSDFNSGGSIIAFALPPQH